MSSIDYAGHEKARGELRTALAMAVLDEVQARCRAGGETTDAYAIAESILSWEQVEFVLIRDVILGSFGYDDGAGEDPPDPDIATADARDLLSKRGERNARDGAR